MLLSLIVAASENDVIGKGGTLPWKLPDELAYFRETTSAHPVIMGRKTYESIGKPLPLRRNIIVTRNTSYVADGCDVVTSLDDARRLAEETGTDEAFVIGGGELYRESVARADRIYLTRVHTEIDGDAFFPAIDEDEWEQIFSDHRPADDRHAYAFTKRVLQRKV